MKTEESELLKSDPVFFGEHFFGWRAHDGQKLVLRDNAKFKTISCGRRWGKSESQAVDLLWQACTKPDQKLYIVSISQDQANIIFDRCIAFIADSELWALKKRVVRSPFPRLDLVNGSSIHANSLSYEGKFLRGKNAHKVVVDEASRASNGVVEEVIMPMLLDYDGTLITISTPFGRNWFYDLWMKGMPGFVLGGRETPFANYSSFHFTTYDNPFLPVERIEDDKNRLDDQTFRSEYLAEFIDDQNCVFKSEVISKNLVDYQLNPVPELGKIYYIGADIARQEDFTVITVLDASDQHNVRLVWFERFNQKPYDYIINLIDDLVTLFRPVEVWLDSTSAGTPVLESLQAKHSQIEGFTFSNSIQNPKKLLLIKELKLGLEQGRLKLPISLGSLIEELRFFGYTLDFDSGQETMKAMGSRHDDCVISLALAWHPLSISHEEIQVHGVVPSSKMERVVETDPFFILRDTGNESIVSDPMSSLVDNYGAGW